MTPQRWNHNLHYLPLIIDAVPAGAQRALDLGCGEGTLTRLLRRTVTQVTGIDADPTSIAQARAHPDAADIGYLLDDVLTADVPVHSFDLVTAVAVLHHLDPVPALQRMRDLLRPGGTLVVIGLVRWRLLADLPYVLAATMATQVMNRRRRVWEHPSPVAAPEQTYPQLRRTVAGILPGARVRRHLLWRYSLLWTKPASDAPPSLGS